ncbi:MAG TPA: NUDIX domain-containing protein [Acidimicrobiales bacterium]|nr:NUDIX domain-containing protein [Acidimicrobiales bacterium]
MLAGVQRVLLLGWRRVPRLVRRWIVRFAAPSFTVGAACVIERDDGALLLVRLVYREGWGLPGGLIKRSETVADCARREVAEEVGLAVELTSEAAVVVDSRPQRVDVVFRARPVPGTDPAAAAPRSAEIREVRWFAVDDLPALQHETVSALAALAASVAGGSAAGTGAAGVSTDGPADGGDGLRRAALAARRQRSGGLRE